MVHLFFIPIVLAVVSTEPTTYDYIKYLSPRIKSNYAMEIAHTIDSSCIDLDNKLVVTIIYKESDFHEDAINCQSHDIGLMQINRRTWQKNFNVNLSELFDKHKNIEIGCEILRHYRDRKSERFKVSWYSFYHSSTWKYREPYWNSVRKIMKRLDRYDKKFPQKPKIVACKSCDCKVSPCRQ